MNKIILGMAVAGGAMIFAVWAAIYYQSRIVASHDWDDQPPTKDQIDLLVSEIERQIAIVQCSEARYRLRQRLACSFSFTSLLLLESDVRGAIKREARIARGATV